LSGVRDHFGAVDPDDPESASDGFAEVVTEPDTVAGAGAGFSEASPVAATRDTIVCQS
jgi:hypothetical protein